MFNKLVILVLNLSLVLNKHNAMKLYGVVELQLRFFLTSELSDFIFVSGQFFPREILPGTRWIGGW
jgi:hypothetical protein